MFTFQVANVNESTALIASFIASNHYRLRAILCFPITRFEEITLTTATTTDLVESAPASYVVLSAYSIAPEHTERVRTALQGASAPGTRLFESVVDSEIIALTPVGTALDLAALEAGWERETARIAPFLSGDVRREVLSFVEAPKPSQDTIPGTPWLQLRHIEVKPPLYAQYRAWRERTIFDVVRNAPEIDLFLAYRSVLSTQPGVMFFSGFSCDQDEYQSVFDSPRYRDIVAEAGDQFIAGGAEGLYTKLYRALSAPVAAA
jgi:hypothetical protein